MCLSLYLSHGDMSLGPQEAILPAMRRQPTREESQQRQTSMAERWSGIEIVF